MKITTLDEALKRIKELEKEVAELKAENEKLLFVGCWSHIEYLFTVSLYDFQMINCDRG